MAVPRLGRIVPWQSVVLESWETWPAAVWLPEEDHDTWGSPAISLSDVEGCTPEEASTRTAEFPQQAEYIHASFRKDPTNISTP